MKLLVSDAGFSITANGIGLNAVGVHTELNGTSGSMLSQMLKGTPCLLRFSPCYKIVCKASATTEMRKHSRNLTQCENTSVNIALQISYNAMRLRSVAY